MGHIFKYLGSREQARGLWENKESLRKYLDHLRDLMMADPNSRMTEDETAIAARIRAELYNSGLRGKELTGALRERLLESGVEKSEYLSEKNMEVTKDLPRRIQMEHWVPAEKAIHEALQVVERMPADTRLTMAGLKLTEAQRLVADFIDGENPIS